MSDVLSAEEIEHAIGLAADSHEALRAERDEAVRLLRDTGGFHWNEHVREFLARLDGEET